MLKIEDVIENMTEHPDHLDETVFAQLSDQLWELGNLDTIKDKVTPELFHLHIGIQMIGSWKSEGWDAIIGEQADLVPYIPVVLKEFELYDVLESFEDVISLFPDGTCFQSDCEEYYDICNFLTVFCYKAQSEKLKAIAPEKRRELVKLMRQKVSFLDELTKQYWSDSSEKDGWKQVFDYIHKHVRS